MGRKPTKVPEGITWIYSKKKEADLDLDLIKLHADRASQKNAMSETSTEVAQIYPYRHEKAASAVIGRAADKGHDPRKYSHEWASPELEGIGGTLYVGS